MGHGLGNEWWRRINRASKRTEGMWVFKNSRVVSWEMVWGMNSAKRYAGVPNVAKGVFKGAFGGTGISSFLHHIELLCHAAGMVAPGIGW